MSESSQQLQGQKRYNLSWLLFAISAVFWVLNRYRSSNIAMAGYAFTSVIAFPGLFILLGQEAKRQSDKREKLIASGAGMILLGYAQKILLFWVETLLGRAPAFHPFSTGGAPWFFLVGGVFLLLAGAVRRKKWMKRWLLPLTVALALAFGAAKHAGDELCLARIVTYLPFFVLGWQLDLARLKERSALIRNKILSLFILAGGAGVCLLYRSKWAALRGLIDGNKAYDGISGIARIRLGPVYRLMFYLAAAVLLFALYCLVPERKLPLISAYGKRWKSGYFWFSVTVLLMTLPMGGKVSMKGAVFAGLLCLGGLLLSTTKWMNLLPDAILNGPERLQKEAPEERAPANGLRRGSFYQRHRWGIELTALYTGCFLVAAMGFVFPFLANGKSLIWSVDGLGQQYPMILYTKRYLLGVFQNLVQNGTLTLPQWDFTMGFGMAAGDNLNWEPFALLSLFATDENLEALYALISVLRLYVCGLSFLWYCAEIGKREKTTIVMGALVFVFSGHAVMAAIRETFYVTIMMTYFVLMLVGIERYLRTKNPAIFVTVIFAQFVSGYYSTFINSLLMAVYLLLRLWSIYGKDIGAIVGKIIRLIGYYAWGMAMAMAVLLPALVPFFASGRSEGKTGVSLLYGKSYYQNLFTGLNLEAGSAGYRTYAGFASLAILACVLLFLRRRRELRPLKAGVCTAVVFVCLPVVGWIFTGFGYVTNRWCFAIGFLLGLVLVELAPELLQLSRRERLGMILFVVAYCVIVVANEQALSIERYMGLVVLGVTAVLVLTIKEFLPGRRLQLAALALMTLVNVTFSTAAVILPNFGNYAEENVDRGAADAELIGNMRLGLSAIDDDSFYRVSRPARRSNESLQLGYNGTNSYYSVLSADISDYFTGLGLDDQYQTFSICGLDQRAALMELMSVKYYIAENQKIVPYGYRLMETVTEEGEGGKTAYVYENPYALPIGYTYTSYIPEVEYDKLTPLERQQVMLDHVVWDGNTTQLEKGTSDFEEEAIACTVAAAKGITVDEEKHTLETEVNGTLTLEFEGLPNCETYLVLRGLEDATAGSNTTTVLANMDGLGKSTLLYSKARTYYFDREFIVFNFGYSETAHNQCTLRFTRARDYTYKEMYVVCVPMDDYTEKVSALRETVLENVVQEPDRITGTIDLEESRMLAFSIPAAPGWTAYVDGEVQPLEIVNKMYYGLLLQPGSHEVELVYRHPGQTAGNVISVIAIGAVIPALAVKLVRRGKERRQSATKSQCE